MNHNRRARRIAQLILSSLSITAVTGCPPLPKHQPKPEPPPRTDAEIIAAVEANSALLDRALYSNSVQVTARFKDADGRERVFNLDCIFLFEKPRRLRMDLKHSLADKSMEIGSNDEDYWFWIEPELGMMRWGRHRHVGKPCTGSAIIRPDQLVACLGLGSLRSPAKGLIGPARVYGTKYDKLKYLRQGPNDTYFLDREYWIERVEPYLIRVVVFRGRFGKRATTAFLDDYRPAWEGGPLAPHWISIFWPADDAKFTMKIDRYRGEENVPPLAYRRPSREQLPPGVTDIVQIDAACDESEPDATPRNVTPRG